MFTVKPPSMASSTDPFRGIKIQRRSLGPKDILIDVDYAGMYRFVIGASTFAGT